MRTSDAAIRARGIDSNFTALLRERALGHLRDAQEAERSAERYFEEAAAQLADDRYPKLAEDWLDLAFRVVERARGSRRAAKAAALLATRGTWLDCWTAERRRAHRLETEARWAKWMSADGTAGA